MEQSTFWELFDTHEIDAKIYRIDNTDAVTEHTEDGVYKSDKSDEILFGEIVAFEYDSKYYLRIYIRYPNYTCDRTPSNGKRYRMSRDYCYIKEFNDKVQANNYFKKVVKGYEYHRA